LIERTGYSRVHHGFRPQYSCENKLITVFQDSADSLDNGSRIDNIIMDVSKAFDLVPHDLLFTKYCGIGSGVEDSCMDKRIPSGPYSES
jgi:hypothetical protein